MNSFKTLILASTISFSWCLACQADWVNSQNYDYFQLGHLLNWGSGCAPTATANSFNYLWNRFPGVYGRTGFEDANNDGQIDNLSDIRFRIGDFMGTQYWDPSDTSKPGYGTYTKEWWEGKVEWFDTYAPNTTKFSGMTDQNFNSWDYNQFLKPGKPTFEYLWCELSRGEDVEIRIQLSDGSGHALTLTGLSFDDQDGSGTLTDDEEMLITFLDPNVPSQMFFTRLDFSSDGLSFLWNNGSNTPDDVTITSAFSESPVPEPSTFLLLGVGLGGLALLRRKAKK